MTLERCKKLLDECQAQQAKAKASGETKWAESFQKQYLSLIKLFGKLQRERRAASA